MASYSPAFVGRLAVVGAFALAIGACGTRPAPDGSEGARGSDATGGAAVGTPLGSGTRAAPVGTAPSGSVATSEPVSGATKAGQPPGSLATTIKIVEPADGGSFTAGPIPVRVEIQGIQVESPSWHLYVDGQSYGVMTDVLETVVTLEPGDHELKAAVSMADGSLDIPDVQPAIVHITVTP